MPTLIEAEATIALTCYSNVNLESRMTPKIFNSETISTTKPSITKSGNKGSTVREWKISIPLVLLGFTNIPHLLHQSLITAKQSFNDDATDDLSRECGILQSKVESSAKPTSSFWSSLGRSAIYNKNNNGPRTLPCGTPDTTSILELHTPSSYLNSLSTTGQKILEHLQDQATNSSFPQFKHKAPMITLSKAAGTQTLSVWILVRWQDPRSLQKVTKTQSDQPCHSSRQY